MHRLLARSQEAAVDVSPSCEKGPFLGHSRSHTPRPFLTGRRQRAPDVAVDMLDSRLVAAQKIALGGGWRTVVRGRRPDVSPVFLTTD